MRCGVFAKKTKTLHTIPRASITIYKAYADKSNNFAHKKLPQIFARRKCPTWHAPKTKNTHTIPAGARFGHRQTATSDLIDTHALTLIWMCVRVCVCVHANEPHRIKNFPIRYIKNEFLTECYCIYIAKVSRLSVCECMCVFSCMSICNDRKALTDATHNYSYYYTRSTNPRWTSFIDTRVWGALMRPACLRLNYRDAKFIAQFCKCQYAYPHTKTLFTNFNRSDVAKFALVNDATNMRRIYINNQNPIIFIYLSCSIAFGHSSHTRIRCRYAQIHSTPRLRWFWCLRLGCWCGCTWQTRLLRALQCIYFECVFVPTRGFWDFGRI